MSTAPNLCPPAPKRLKSEIHTSRYQPSHLQANHQVLMTNDDILGDEIPAEKQEQLRRFCIQSLNPGGDYVRRQFPGSHPVSLNRDNLKLMRQQYYYATWKADGTRYMLLITKDGCYLIDRRFNFRRVQMRFPCNKNSKTSTHHYTLLDGEMVIDTLPGSLEKQRRYLVYDLITINSRCVVNWPFHERWNMIEKEVIEPRNRDHMYELEPFKVRRKDFYLLSTTEKLLKVIIPKQLTHEADGLIFQGRDDPYVQGTHEGLLKWKYPKMNSVDFLFEIGGKGQQLLFLYERGRKKLLEGHRVAFKDGSDRYHYSGKIIECSWDCEKKEWVCMRIRSDKSTPNAYNTYKKVMESIKDNITEETLVNEVDEIICLPMYVERMRKAAQHHVEI